jgi:hypothetical protein
MTAEERNRLWGLSRDEFFDACPEAEEICDAAGTHDAARAVLIEAAAKLREARRRIPQITRWNICNSCDSPLLDAGEGFVCSNPKCEHNGSGGRS